MARRTATAATANSALEQWFSLTGKVALVTGAGADRGLGSAPARALAAAGATVLVADAERRVADTLVDELANGGWEAAAFEADAGDEAPVNALFDEVRRRYGQVDVLVNASTRHVNAPLTELSVDEWDAAQRANVRGAFLCMREAIRLMVDAGISGRIINISTVGGVHPVLHGNAAYSASKGALGMLTRSAALDYAEHGITVNAILPGALLAPEAGPNFRSSRTGPGADPKRHLLGYGTADDLVSAVLFLAGPGARLVTGQFLTVDAGFLVS